MEVKEYFFHFLDYFLLLYRSEYQFTNLTNYLHKNALFGYDFVYDVDSNIIAIRDIVRKSFTNAKPNVADLSHPFINTTDRNKTFTASNYNCFPNVVYLNENGSR